MYKNRKKVVYFYLWWITGFASSCWVEFLCCCVGQCSCVLVCCLSSCLYLVKAPLPNQPLSPMVWWSQTIELQDSKQSTVLKHQTNHSDYFDKYLKFNLDGVAFDSILPRMNSIMCMKPLLVTRSINPTPWSQPLPPILKIHHLFIK